VHYRSQLRSLSEGAVARAELEATRCASPRKVAWVLNERQNALSCPGDVRRLV